VDFLAGGRLEVRITPADVGKRVSIRRLTGPGESGARFTDAVGVLTSWDGGEIRLTRRDGGIVRIAEASMVAAKVVPAAPPPGRGRRRAPGASSAPVAELTRVAARGWPALERERLGEWELRASAGFTRRANSVLPAGDPGMPLDDALALVRRWYEARGLPAIVQVTTGAEGAQDELALALDARGWAAGQAALVQVASLAPLADAGSGVERVVLSRTADAGWLSVYNRAGALGAEASRVLHGGPSVWFASVPGGPDGGPAAIGRCVVDGRWAGFAAIETRPGHRRRGLATAMTAALAARAVEEGASAAYLQVEPENSGARAVYAGLGFVEHHGYHYRVWGAA
jgi:N-acetylglutamate synthase